MNKFFENESKNNIGIVILAGGHSRRMGLHNKAHLEIGGKTFMEQLILELGGLGPLIISAREEGQYASWQSKVVVDSYKDCGPMGGLHAALRSCKLPWAFVVACDMPMVSKELVACLAKHISPEVDAVILRDERGMHPLCGLYRSELWRALEKQLETGNYRIQSALASVRTKYVSVQDIPNGETCINNINTPQEYEKLAAQSALGR